MTIALDSVKFDEQGLIPVIVQTFSPGGLMMAWANRESLEQTASTGEMTFWSRSRKELWRKGAASGNTMKVLELRADCDGDALLAIVEPSGPACHTESVPASSTSSPTGARGKGRFRAFSGANLEQRRHDAPEESYTARLLARGARRVAQKVGEEGLETALAVAAGDAKETVCEAADLLYHLHVALLASGLSPRDIYAELERRHGAPAQGQSTALPS